MGNKSLRPTELQSFTGFTDDNISYLKDKFEALCDDKKLLHIEKISECLKTTLDQANKILNYIDFQGHGQVDFYQFTCAAASLHQNDDEAKQFLFDIYCQGQQLNSSCFNAFFGTIFRYLKFLNIIDEQYSPEIGQKKFKKYDFNQNGSISFQQFKSMLHNDYHCSLWMQVLGFAEQIPKQFVPKPQNHEIDDSQFLLEQTTGEQAGSTPSWIKTVQYMAPDDFSMPKHENAPTENIQIGYIYGYRCYDTRDNLRYNSNGEIVYHTAGCGIVLNKSKNTMRVNTTHNDDITCLDNNFNKNLVATGEMGRRPSIVIWDSNTLQTRAIFQNKLEKSIATITISKTGRYVAATSMNDNHEIAVYDINKNSLVAYGRGPRSVVYSIKINKNQDQIICACAKQVVFVKFAQGKLQTKKGVFGKAPLKANYCVALLGDIAITSMSNGLLAEWRGNYCSRVYKQHLKAVGALCEREDGGIISGDIAGNIVIWSMNMSKERQIKLAQVINTLNNPRIISLYEHNEQILIGTRGGQIVQLGRNNAAQVYMQGHFDNELWGLAICPKKNQFITGGQDKILYKWDMLKRKALIKRKLQHSINSIDVSFEGVLAVGHRNGHINFHDSLTFNHIKKICTFSNPDKDMISVVKFSPNGRILAVGYNPPISKVYLYDVNSSQKIGQCKGSPSRILSIDYSHSGQAIMINNTSYEILFYRTSNASQITSATSFKGEEWSTLTSRFSWATQGIWPPCSDGSDINALDRSNSRKYLATGDDFSKVKIFKYPVCQNRQIYSSYKGHSSHITGVKWSYDDRFLITTGGLEKSIIQWTTEDQPEINYDYQQPQSLEEKKIQEEEQYDFQPEEAPKDQEPEEGEFGLEVDSGDQALAVKPFLGQVKASTPLQYKCSSQKNIQPEQNLEILHVWGVRNQYLNDRVRNQVRYISNGTGCIFITAALGVEMDFKTKKQTFYQQQEQDLISFDISPDRRICATGQMAQRNLRKPKDKIVDVHIWDAHSKQHLQTLTKFHQRGIVLVQFSPSGKKILTVGQDDKNSLAVYDWQINRIAWSSPVCGAKVTAAAWKNQNQYLTVGFKHVKFWTAGKGRMGKIPSKWQPMLSAVYWNNKFVTGGAEGNIYLWSGNSGTPTKGHTGRIDCISVDLSQNLYSGDSNGLIIKWKCSGGKLVLDQQVFQMSKVDTMNAGILSIDFTPSNILICTNSSTIYEGIKNSSENQFNIIMQAHHRGQLWAECWSPDAKMFITAGDDRTIRIYDSKTYIMLHYYQMKQQIRGIDWQQNNGQLIIVGDYKGKIYLFSKQLELLSEKRTKFSRTRPRKEPFWIEDIKFSPNGTHIAFGAHGGASHIEIYQIKDNQISSSKIINHIFSSALLTLDWSQGSDMLAAVSQAYELQFTSLEGRISASSVRDVKWASWSSKFGFCVQQIHQDVDYSNINAVCVNPTRSLIATGGDDQKIRLFNYPVTIPKQKNKAFIGHSSHVTRVRFSRDQTQLLSVGGNDRTIILWNLIGHETIEKQPTELELAQNNLEEYEGYQDTENIMFPKPREEKKAKIQTETQDQFALEEDEGDQFMAVKPWLGAIKEPTVSYYKGIGKPPPIELELEYAHGYRVKDCRNNLKYVSNREVCYHTAGIGVIMQIDVHPNKQRFFKQHNDDIISIQWNSTKNQVYTGQMGAKPVIYGWDLNGSILQTYRGVKKGVSAIGVSDNHLIAAGLDDNHYVYLFNKQKGKLMASEKGGRDVIIAMKWTNETTFVSIGIKHFKQWAITDKSLKGKTGIFGKNCNILCCVTVQNEDVYVGASNGQLQIWRGNQCTKNVKAHSKALHAICLQSQLLITGSSDKTIKFINRADLTIIITINCIQMLEQSINASIRALDVNENRILVGTLGSEIYEIKCNQIINNVTTDGDFRLIANYMNGHYAPNYVTNEVWGLALYDELHYVTCADDGTVRIWDIQKKQKVTTVKLNFDNHLKQMKPDSKSQFLPDSTKGRCVAISEQKDIIIGCKDGTVKIVDDKMRPKYSNRICKKEISYVKFSPDKAILAIGAHDGRIYLYDWTQQGKIKPKSRSIKHNSYIKHFDFSKDGNFIHSTCGSYELLFWDANTGKQITSGATMTRDQEWASWNVTLGWPVQGIFQRYMDGTDINSVDRSKSSYQKGMQLLASGDDRGKVRILEYPCIVKNSQGVYGKGHSSHVTNVTFSVDDTYIISTGGQDQTIMQWKIISKI